MAGAILLQGLQRECVTFCGGARCLTTRRGQLDPEFLFELGPGCVCLTIPAAAAATHEPSPGYPATSWEVSVACSLHCRLCLSAASIELFEQRVGESSARLCHRPGTELGKHQLTSVMVVVVQHWGSRDWNSKVYLCGLLLFCFAVLYLHR